MIRIRFETYFKFEDSEGTRVFDVEVENTTELSEIEVVGYLKEFFSNEDDSVRYQPEEA